MDVENHQLAHERAVGITTFISPETQAFKCTVKQRYTDFLVNEILPDGTVLHFTDSPVSSERKRKREVDPTQPAEGEDAQVKKPRAEPAQEDAVQTEQTEPESSKVQIKEVKDAAIASISESDRLDLSNVFGEQTATSIINLYAAVIAFPERKARDHHAVKSEPIQEKSKRTEAHLCVRRIFGAKLETLTVQDHDHQSGPGTIISIKAAPPKALSSVATASRNADNKRGKPNWSELGGDYLHFTLYKENKDTMEVLYFLASQLKLNIKNFSFAGTKDRRGVTVQRVAVFRVRKERLEGLNLIARGWRLGGPWVHQTSGLDLGMLKGNEFVITLRNVEFLGEEDGWNIEQRLEHARKASASVTRELSERGFLNYYGLQRFGTHSTGTHETGMKMLKGDLEGAVNAILSYDPALLPEEGQNGHDESQNGTQANGDKKQIPQDEIARASAIHSFRTRGSSQDAITRLPSNRFQAEKGIITYLGKRTNQNDYQGALMQIQRNLRLMYVHAYQSYVWNTVAERRWELFGNRVVQGDLVITGEKEQEEGLITGATGPAVEEVDEDGEPIIHPSATAAAGTAEAIASGPAAAGGVADDPFVRARPLSQAEAESGRFTIFDVILPLPGYDVEYPANEIGKFYEEFMASDSGGGLDPHNMRRAWKDISLSGGYRKMLVRPLDQKVEVEVKAYTKADEQMVETDLEAAAKQHGVEENTNGSNGNAMTDESHAASANAGAEREKIALVVKMQLGSSQYATIALRELSKGGALPYQPDYSVLRK